MRASLLLCSCWLLACQPQEVHLFSPVRAQPDSGTTSGVEADASVTPPPAPAAPEQPACRSPECSSCAAEPSACLVSQAQWLCHPWTGSCALPCDPQSPSSQCPREQRCHPDYGLCVDCVGSAECLIATPACDLQRNVCVECTGDALCSGSTPACDTEAQRCVECTQREHCAAGQVCDTTQHRCVQCVGDTDCPNPGGDEDRVVCDPTNHVCVECLSDDDCTDPDKPFCKASELECEEDDD